MSSLLHIEEKFVRILEPRLRNFKQKSTNPLIWNFSCPVCGDSKTIKTKARGFIFQKDLKLIYKCHNCNLGVSLPNLLKSVDVSMYEQFLVEKFRALGINPRNKEIFRERKEEERKIDLLKHSKGVTFVPDIGLPSIASLYPSHPAKTYTLDRKIPQEHHKRLFYADDFKAWVLQNFPQDKYKDLKSDSRLVLAFFDASGKLQGAQGRAIGPSSIRYVTVRQDPDYRLIYGLDRWNSDELTYVVEGPIDSLFLPNALAAASSDLLGAMKVLSQRVQLDWKKIIFICDNEPRNKQIVKGMLEIADAGHNISILPDTFKSKDVNDLSVELGIDGLALGELFQRYKFKGMQARLKINTWSKK